MDQKHPDQEDKVDVDQQEDVIYSPDDVIEVIDLDDGSNADVLSSEMADVDIEESYDADIDDVDGAMGGDDEESMEDLTDDSDLVLRKHQSNVFSVSIDPATGTLGVTGGEDDKAYLWNLVEGTVMFECTGHKDSVTCVGFNHDSTMVATGDMSGLINVWRVQDGSSIWSFEASDLEWMEWHHSAPVLLAGTSDGMTWMWKVPSGELKTFQGPSCQATCGQWLPDGKRACVGYDDGVVKIWDLKTGAGQFTLSDGDAHKSSVTCLDCHHDNTLIATGSTDVTCRLINSHNGKVLGIIDAGDQQQEGANAEDSIESVAFSPSLQLLATGSLNGMLGIWDVPTQVLRHNCKQTGIVKLKWDPTGPLVYTVSLDGLIRLWDGRSGNLASHWSGHHAEILDFDVSRDGSTLVTASGDGSTRVFHMHRPDR
ncbi:PREDICTED: angio-associated migratory cell protein-like isoform X2 [Priapulus caudatus]|nr:PREDICTED: angio-associated migratory cell protein-like isoform X2 [Priapulus caudatus]